MVMAASKPAGSRPDSDEALLSRLPAAERMAIDVQVARLVARRSRRDDPDSLEALARDLLLRPEAYGNEGSAFLAYATLRCWAETLRRRPQ
jgi:hypothetical protein